MKANSKRAGVADYWRARGDRAIAERLLSTYLILDACRERLHLYRSTITLLADLPRQDDEQARRMAERVARYYHAEGELARRAARLGRQLDQRTETAVDGETPRASSAGRVLSFGLKRHVDAHDRPMTGA